MTREEAVIILDGFKNNPLFSDTHAQALDMAIASLKTDEAYQLEYENRDFVEIPKGMTNGEVFQAIFPNASVFENQDNEPYPYIDVFLCGDKDMNCYRKDWWNAPYQVESEE